MRHLNSFNEHYKFELIENDEYYKSYEFTTKNNIHMLVKFVQLGLKRDNSFTREYYIIGGVSKYAELEQSDSFAVLDTVTKITVQFIQDYKPNKIEIDHIPSKKERDNKEFIKDYLDNKVITKRALINKRFLERDLPKNYSYELVRSKSIITKNPSL